MELIKDLGSRDTPWKDSSGKTLRAKYGLFKCGCGAEIERMTYKGTKQKTCNSCKNRKHGISTENKQVYSMFYNMRAAVKKAAKKGLDYPKMDGAFSTFDAFWEAMKDSYVDGYLIKVRDPTKGYFADNMKWAPKGSGSKCVDMSVPVSCYRQVIVDGKKDIRLVKSWDTITEASAEMEVKATGISNAMAGKYKTYAGFVWKKPQIIVESQTELTNEF